MRTISKVIALGFLLVLATACVAPPPSPEQATAYAQVAESRATEAVAAEKIAAAKATEAAAAQQIAQVTADAAASAAITTTATVSPTILITSTIPTTSTVVLSPTIQISLTLTDLLTSPIVTATVEVTATPAVSLTVVATSTATATAVITFTATPPATVTAVVTATATPVATPTPQPTAAGSGWVWPGLPAPGSGGQVSAATPTVAPTPVSFGAAVVRSQQANVRGGPGTAFPVVGTARQGTTLQVTGSNEGQSWWQVCCVDGKSGWASQTVARFQGDQSTVPVVGPLMPDDLSAAWELRWECHGSGCNQEECLGQSQASALRAVDDRWLEVARTSSWPDGCGEPEDWLTQIDRYTGKERQSSASATLFNIWEGANPGPSVRSVDLLGTRLSVWCTDTRTEEVPQQDGWTILYEGQACYDREAGVLALMQYVKRWLFSGTVNGQTFEKEYFGDYEVYQQVLTGANAPLSGG